MRDVRVFISSPADAAFERQRVVRILERLNGELAGVVRFVPIRWEDHLYKAHSTFQAQIPEAAACDIVLAIFRTRLGSPLPADFIVMPSGEPYPSGTAYEVLTAITGSKYHGLPDVYVFRNPEPPSIRLDDPERADIEKQWEQLKAFFDRWFQTPEGQFKAAFQQFSSTDDFEQQAESALRQWIASHVHEGRTLTWSIAQKGSPFRGLESFGAKHAPVFFGRDREIRRGINALKDSAERGAPFLLLLGPSGSGKSSLVRAGLVPRITAPGAVPKVDVWRVAVLRPSEGVSPIAALASQLLSGPDDIREEERGRPFALLELTEGDYPNAATLTAALTHDDDSAVQPVVRALEKVAERARALEGHDRPVTSRLLIVVDQLDELFAAQVPEDARAAFARLLVRLIASGQVWIVGTLRDELYSIFQKEAALRDLKERGASLDVYSPGPAELVELVRGPAEAAGLSFEKNFDTGETLDERILRDAERGDLLPLLQFTLNCLFEAREGARLTFAAYAELGGIEGAVDREAESTISALPSEAQAKLGRLVRRLATRSQGSLTVASFDVRPMPLAEVNEKPTQQLVSALVNARILLTSCVEGEAVVRLAHARVLESWRRAEAIAGESSDFYRVRADVEEQFRRWKSAKERGDLLISSGLLLAEAENLARRFGDELSKDLLRFVALSSRRARTFERRVAAVAVLFLGLAIAALFFGLESRRAQRQAEMTLSAAKQAVNGLIFDVAQGLKDVEGIRAESMLKVLETATQTMTDLVETAPDDKDLQRSRAAMFINFGDVYVKTGSPSALSTYEKALAIARKLAADPADTAAQRDISVSLNRIGDVKLRSGNVAGAIEAYEGGLAIARKLAAIDSSNGSQRDVLVSLNRIGDVKLRSGDAEKALRTYEEGLAIARNIAAGDPSNLESLRDVSISLQLIADIHFRSNQAQRALKTYEESLAIRRKLASADPGNVEWHRDVSISLIAIGDLELRRGDADTALKNYEESLNIVRKLARSDAGNADWQRDISVALNKIGDVKLQSRDAVEALSAYEEGLAIRRKLAAANPGNAELQHDVLVSLNKIGDAKLLSGDAEGALEDYEKGLALAQNLTATNPSNLDCQRDVSMSLDRIGDLKSRSGDRQGALKAYEESSAAMLKLATVVGPGDVQAQTHLIVTDFKIAQATADMRRRNEALEDALRIVKALDEKGLLLPEQRNWQATIEAALAN